MREADSLEQAVAGLEQKLQEAGAPDDLLDDLVHDALDAQGVELANATDDELEQENHLDSASAEASAINNRGFRAQLEALLTSYGLDEGRRLVLETLQECSPTGSGPGA